MGIAEVGRQRVFSERPKSSYCNPDWEVLNYGRIGEFSPASDISFEKHIKRLASLKDFFISKNGDRLKCILQCEGLWYGRI